MTKHVEKKTGADLSIDRFYLDPWDDLTLKGLVLIPQEQDTMAKLETLQLSFKKSLFSLMRQELALKDLEIEGAYFLLKKESGKDQANIAEWLKLLLPPKGDESEEVAKKEKGNFLIDLESISLSDVYFVHDNQWKGNYEQFYVEEAQGQIREVDLDSGLVRFSTVRINNPWIDVVQVPVPEIEDEDVIIEDPILFLFDDIVLSNGRVKLDNGRAPPRKLYPGKMNLSQFELSKINISMLDFSIQDWHFGATTRELSLEVDTGFKLHAEADYSTVTPTQADVNGILVKAGSSILRDTFIFRYNEYPDWQDLENRIFMELSLDQSRLLIDDLTHFVPALAHKPLFHDNRRRYLKYDGKLLGRINNLRGRDATISLDDLLEFEGSFSSRNLTFPDEELFNFEFDYLRTSADNLKTISPGFAIPKNFSNLGTVIFRGYFDGLIEDFVMSGSGTSELGDYRLDMRLDTKQGKESANYSGTLSVQDFALDGWTQNDDFGRSSFTANVQNGKGLTLESVDAFLTGSIEEFSYRGHVYRNVEADGEFRNKLFNGHLEIHEESADLVFDGIVDFREDPPKVDFKADIATLDLQELNFRDEPFTMSGQVELDLIGITIDSAIGTAKASNLVIDDGRVLQELEELELKLAMEGGERIVVADSDIGELKINGDFRLSQIANDIKYLIKSQYPDYFDLMGLSLPIGYSSSAFFNYSLEFEDSRELLNLLGARNVRFYEVESDGVVDNRRPGSNVNIAFDSLRLKRFLISDVQLSQSGDRSSNILGTYVGGVDFGNISLSPIDIEGDINPDEILFSIQTARVNDVTPMLDVLGELRVTDEGFVFHFDRLFDRAENWILDPNNRLAINDSKVDITDFAISKEGKSLVIRKSRDEDGLEGMISGIDLGLINEIWDYPKLDFAGNSELSFSLDKLAGLGQIDVSVYSDGFIVNEDDYGELKLNGSWYKADRTMDVDLRMSDGESSLSSQGIVRLSSITSDERTHYDFTLRIDDYPLDMLEYFLGDGISETRGLIDVEAQISDIDGRPVPSGYATIDKGYTKVNYLQAGFFIKNQRIDIRENIFDATGAQLEDINGNVGVVTGGIRHDYLSKPRLDVSVYGENVLALDTKKGDNNLYYGRAEGELFADFKGPFSAVDINIRGVAKDGTSLVIPIEQESEYEDESSFVRFVDPSDTFNVASDALNPLTGVNVKMDLSITDQADMKIIFNERTGDILQGRGRGDLAVEVTRDGLFEVFGDYQVEEGEYLFTKGWINKRFSVVRGGTIKWTGDPINANIDIDAKYDGLSSSLSTFLDEYLPLASESTRQQAQNRTDIDLSLLLRGSLLQPDISFDLAFPNLTGELRSLADSKMRALKSDRDALYQQVGGLIAFRTFLPTTNVGGGYAGIAASSGFNTVSEFLSNQLSVLVSGLLAEAVDDVDFISSLDFRFDLSNYETIEEQPILESSEILLKLKPSFLDDRLVFDAGANIVNNSPISSGAFIGEDVVIEYLLSQDGRLKLRAFQKSEESIEGRVRRFGIGLSYRKEFDSFGEFFRKVKKQDLPSTSVDEDQDGSN